MSLPEPFEEIPVRELENRIDQSPVPILVYLYEPDANLCELIKPEVEKVSRRLNRRLQFFAVNLPDNKNFGYDRRIMRSPAFVIYREGEEIRRWVEVNYHEAFQNEYREFLVGDFLFDTTEFERVDETDINSKLASNFRLGVVCFFNPSDPVNWKLRSILEEFKRRHPSQVRLFLVNHQQNKGLIQQFGLSSPPAVICREESTKLKSWDNLRNVQQFEQQLEALVT